ncbi:MAG: aminotransferase class IV, partial [Candidatus Omnitrophica bacterium]|nr:aminotransferase class IV [Candidatus Omnitrophota bacterium]
IIARNESMSEGSFETVFLNESGYVCEGTVSNIFMVNGNKMLTPAVGCGVLPGVTRKVILESAPFAGLAVEEGSFDEDFLKESEEVFITNSIIELVPVVKIGSKIVGNGKVGPVAKKMHKMYSELIKSETGQGESINK